MSDTIWPSRTIELNPRFKSGDSLSDRDQVQIKVLLSDGGRRRPLIEDHAVLDTDHYGSVHLIELFTLGPDGVGSGQLLLRLTLEINEPEAELRLSVVPYADRRGSSSVVEKPFQPDTASKLLDELVHNIERILCL